MYFNKNELSEMKAHRRRTDLKLAWYSRHSNAKVSVFFNEIIYMLW